jgi:glycosyltransferase involved in cell wall biosynthesis
MKILRISPSFASVDFPGSGLNAYYHAINSSNKNLILTEFKQATYMPVPSGVRIIPIKINNISLGRPGKFNSFRIINFYKKLLSTIKFFLLAKDHIDLFAPDIVHLYTPIHLISGLYCKFKFKSKLVVSLHGTDVLRISASFFYKFVLNLCDSILLLSYKMKNELSLNHKDISYIGNGFDNKIFNFNEDVKRKKIILTVGNLRWQKDHQSLIKAFSNFKKKHPEYILLIVGTGVLEGELKKLASSEGISDFMEFKGKLSHSDISELMQQADFFVLSSVSEGSPKVVLEAMSCGLPIVSTSVGDIPKLIKGYGLSCPPSNPLLLSKTMSDCVDLCNKINRNEISNRVSSRTWKNITHSLEEKYRKLISND